MAALLQPLRNLLPWPNGLSGSIVDVSFALLFAGLLVLLGWLLSKPILAEASQWPKIVESMNAKLAEWTGAAGLSDSVTVQGASEQILNWLTGAGGELFKRVMDGAGVALVGFAFFAFGFVYLLSEKNGEIIRAMQRLLPRHEGAVENYFNDLSVRLRWVGPGHHAEHVSHRAADRPWLLDHRAAFVDHAGHADGHRRNCSHAGAGLGVHAGAHPRFDGG